MKGIINNLTEGASRLIAKGKFKLQKISPELLIVGGVGCVIGATVMACKATRKAEDVIDDAQETIEKIRSESEAVVGQDEDGNDVVGTVLTKADQHDILMTKAHAVGKMARVYAPAMALGAAGIAMICTSHGIMKQRNGALLASYNALDAAFKSYRERVLAEEDGAERDRKYLTGDRTTNYGPVELSEGEFNEMMNPEDIDEINQRAAREAQMAALGPYSFIFDSFTTSRWSAHSLSNLNVIRSTEDWANRQLRLNGHLFLNDVLDELGMDKVPWGQIVGWIRGSREGDSYIEIIADDQRTAFDLDDDTCNKPIYLEFNCDGAIWTKI